LIPEASAFITFVNHTSIYTTTKQIELCPPQTATMVRVRRTAMRLSGYELIISNATSASKPVRIKKAVKKRKKKPTGWDEPKKYPKKAGFSAFDVRQSTLISSE
jgi:hypothetical protein